MEKDTMPDWVKSKFAEMFKEKPKIKVGTVTEKTCREYLFDKKVARWNRQFDNLYKKFGKNQGGFRFLKVGDKHLSRQEFINYKYQLGNKILAKKKKSKPSTQFNNAF